MLEEARDRLTAERDELRRINDETTTQLLKVTAQAGLAEGQVTSLRDALADLSVRLDRAEVRLALPWWRRLLG